MKSGRWAWPVLVLMALGVLLPVLAGCAKQEEPQPAGYYTGPRDPKGGGGGNKMGGAQ